MTSMENGFEQLEEKIHRAVETVRRLRKESRAAQEDVAKLKGRLEDSERRLATLEKEKGAGTDRAREVERLAGELDGLQKERVEVKSRIAKLVEVLEQLE